MIHYFLEPLYSLSTYAGNFLFLLSGSWTFRTLWEALRSSSQFSYVCVLSHFRTSLVAQMVKHLPTMWETLVRSLGQEDPLEKEMAIHSSTLVWEIPWTENPGGLQSMGSQRVGHDWATSLHFTLSHFSQVRFFVTPWTVSLPSSSVHGILQERILERVVMPSSRGSSWPRDWI